MELGWLIAREHWGLGYATEAARAALAYAFDTLGMRRLISLIQPGNAASVRVAEKVGESYEGTTRVRGQQVLVYAINRPRSGEA